MFRRKVEESDPRALAQERYNERIRTTWKGLGQAIADAAVPATEEDARLAPRRVELYTAAVQAVARAAVQGFDGVQGVTYQAEELTRGEDLVGVPSYRLYDPRNRYQTKLHLLPEGMLVWEREDTRGWADGNSLERVWPSALADDMNYRDILDNLNRVGR